MKNNTFMLSIVAICAIVAIVLMTNLSTNTQKNFIKSSSFGNTDLNGQVYGSLLNSNSNLINNIQTAEIRPVSGSNPDSSEASDNAADKSANNNLNCTWSDWKNRDTPSGTGDWETKVSFPDVCATPLAVECKTLGGVDYTQTGQVVICDTENGSICQNKDNPGGCLDYKARFCCPPDTVNNTLNTCADTDGENYYLKGIVYGMKNGIYYNFTDECSNDAQVKEHFCVGTQPFARWVDCSSGCQDGACLQSVNNNITLLLNYGEQKNISYHGISYNIKFVSYEDGTLANYGNPTATLNINGDQINIRRYEYKEFGGLRLYIDLFSISNIGSNTATLEITIPYDACNEYNNYCQGSRCGDKVLTENEQCEGVIGASLSCNMLGFDSGTIICGDNCQLAYNCYNYTAMCGNNYKEGSEQCDNSDLGFITIMNVSLQNKIAKTVLFNDAYYQLQILGFNTLYNTIIIKVNNDTRTLAAHSTKTVGGVGVSYDKFNTMNIVLTLKANPVGCANLGYAEGALSCTEQCKYEYSSCVDTSNNSCIDSDGGLNYYTKGTITGPLVSGDIRSDMCIDSIQIRELFCNANNMGEPRLYDCPNGCSDGACKNYTDITYNKTLTDYPAMFFSNYIFTGSVVVGANSAASDIIGSNDIVASLQRYAGNNPLQVGIVKLDTQISDISSRKLIVVGGPCANSVAAQLLGNPYDCTMGLREGEAVIQLIDHQNIQDVLVYGYSGEDTQMATRVLAYWQDYNSVLNGATKICVSGTLNSIIATKC